MGIKFREEPIYSKIEKINDKIYIASLNIPEFTNSEMKGLVPEDYRISAGIDLAPCRAAVKYTSGAELEKVANAGSLKRQIEWLCGRIALKELLRSVKYPELDYRDILIMYSPKGKPVVSGDEDTGISVSHSGELAMAAVHLVPGKKIGIDIERTRGRDAGAIISVAFAAEEKLEHKGKPDDKIIEIFTLKEAYLKLAGSGFNEIITRVSVRENEIYFDGIPVAGIRTAVCDYSPGYKLALIFEE